MSLSTWTPSQSRRVVELAREISAGGRRARQAFAAVAALDAKEKALLDWVEGELEQDAGMLRDPGWRFMLERAQSVWPDLARRILEPERYVEASYPLLVNEVAALLHARLASAPSASTLRRAADAVDAPRIGAGEYRVFFARHVLFAAFLASGAAAPREVEETRRHARGEWRPEEAAILLATPGTDANLRSAARSLLLRRSR